MLKQGMKSDQTGAEASLHFISGAETQSQETPHRWQQPCCRPGNVWVKLQRECSQSDLASVAIAWKPASKRGYLLFASFRPGFGRLCSEVRPKAMAGDISQLTAALPRSSAETILFYQVMFVSGKDL